MVHSKHGVTPGFITLACPLKPSVPPSTMGFIVSSLGLSSESYSVISFNNSEAQSDCEVGQQKLLLLEFIREY